MRLVLTAAALAATFAISSANAEPTFIPGGPTQQGSLCQVSGDSSGDGKFGVLQACPGQPAKALRAAKKKS
jgi:hypothetical protein